MGAGVVDLIGTILRLPIGIVADEPSERRQTPSSGLYIDHSFNDSTDIISISNDTMELVRMVPDVVLLESPGIGMSSILC